MSKKANSPVFIRLKDAEGKALLDGYYYDHIPKVSSDGEFYQVYIKDGNQEVNNKSLVITRNDQGTFWDFENKGGNPDPYPKSWTAFSKK